MFTVHQYFSTEQRAPFHRRRRRQHTSNKKEFRIHPLRDEEKRKYVCSRLAVSNPRKMIYWIASLAIDVCRPTMAPFHRRRRQHTSNERRDPPGLRDETGREKEREVSRNQSKGIRLLLSLSLPFRGRFFNEFDRERRGDTNHGKRARSADASGGAERSNRTFRELERPRRNFP